LTRPDETRQRLIAAAMTVFARYGYRKASMDALAAEVQMSRQSLYNHLVMALGLKHDLGPLPSNPAQMNKRLDRMLRRMLAGA
jgi:dephospho-CoA kinase